VIDQPRFDRWAAALAAEEDRCPWPGPRPFRKGSQYPLVGRDRDRKGFRHIVEQHRLVLLTGASGVGKSSLLEAGLVPELESAGYTVLVCREWSGRDSASRPADFLAGKVRSALARERSDAEMSGYAGDRQIFWQLRDEVGPQGVLVLDQFEELIRYVPSVRDQIFALLAEINARLPLKVVLSFRDEYLLQLQRLERLAQPFSISQYVLDEVDPGHVRDIITSANTLPGRGEAIAPEAADHLVEIWNEARDGDETTATHPSHRVGLLHLQALLYTLYDEAAGNVVSRADVDTFAAARSGGELFFAGLQRSIDVKLDRCRRAAAAAQLDPYLIEGTAHVVALLVRHLSSAGYKLVRDARDLVEATMLEQIESLYGVKRDDAYRALLDAIINAVVPGQQDSGESVRLLDDDRYQIARAADARLTEIGEDAGGAALWVKRLTSELDQREADPRELTSGPMRGLPTAAVLIEELRRFVFATLWLERTSLVRLSTAGGASLMVSLIHDGFGDALLTWSDDQLKSARGALHAITAPRGASFDWRSPANADPMLVNESPRIISNLRWRGAGVHADIRNVVFVNCDFRSTFFRSCNFDGVTFVNCQLENVVLMRCSISSFTAVDLPHRVTGVEGSEPLFMISPRDSDFLGLDQDWLRVVAAYREIDGECTSLLAQVPELPAVPAVHASGGEVASLRPYTGGLAIYGSRISSTVIRAGVGDVVLHNCSGTGFNVVEHGGGEISLYGADLRQVQFSSGERSAEIHICVTDSRLAQVWLEEGLRGSFAAQRGSLLHLWNDSESLTATVTGSTVYGVVGAALTECSQPPGLPTTVESARVD
jgi:Pentapeptide repeats (9 copies)